jgi:hypothetical protein
MNRPLVDVLEFDDRGAMIGWYEDESRAIVLTLVAQMALRLANDTWTDSITLLSASPNLPSMSANSVADFVHRAAAILCPEYRYLSFELLVGLNPIFEISHLDQSIAGVTFTLSSRDVSGSQFQTLFRDSVLLLRDAHPEVDFILSD